MAYIDTSIHTIQNSLKGLIQLSYSPNGCSFQFAPVFKPISPKDIQPGMKIYNYQDAKYFTMDLSEAMTLSHLIEEVLTIMRLTKLGQYQGSIIPGYLEQKGGVSVDVQRQSISVTHYPKQSMSIVSLAADQKNPLVWYFNFNLIQNKQSVFSLSLAIRENDLFLLKEYFKNYINYKASYAASYRLQYDQSTQNNNSGNGGKSYNNSNSNNSYGGGNNYSKNNNYNNSNNSNNGGNNNYNNSNNGGNNNYNNINNGGNNNYNNSNAGGNNYNNSAPASAPKPQAQSDLANLIS